MNCADCQNSVRFSFNLPDAIRIGRGVYDDRILDKHSATTNFQNTETNTLLWLLLFKKINKCLPLKALTLARKAEHAAMKNKK